MAPSDTLIDLGYPAEVELSGSDWPARRTDRWRSCLAALVLLAIATLVADAAPPRLSELLSVSVPGGSFELTDDALYVLTGDRDPGVTAYGLPDAGQRWHLGSDVGALVVDDLGPVILVMGQYCSAPSTFQTVALDAHSGSALWKRPGVEIFTLPGGRGVVLKRPPDAGTCDRFSPWLDPSDAGLPVAWDAVDVANGDPLWSAAIAPGTQIRASYDRRGTVGWLVETTVDGQVTTRDLTTGRAMAVGRLPELAGYTPGSSFGAQPPSAVGDLVVATAVSWDGTLTVAGYSRDTLASRWLTRVPPSRANGSRVRYRATACGTSICLENGASLLILDGASGAVRWRGSGAFFAASDSNGLMGPPDGVLGGSTGGTPIAGFADAAGSAGASTGVAVGGGTVSEPRYGLIDPATGRLRLDLGAWQARVRSHEPSRVVLSLYQEGQTWFERLDTGSARLAVLGSVPGRYTDCAATARYLACGTVTGSVRVWRLPPAGVSGRG